MTESSPSGWEKDVLSNLLQASITEQRRARRWRIFFRFFYISLIILAIVLLNSNQPETQTKPHVALLRLFGTIDRKTEANARDMNRALRSVFRSKNVKAVVLNINSPGGTPVQAQQIYDEILRLRAKYKNRKIYAVIDDVGASGAYFVAAAADQIYASRASMVGSIGVLYSSFGLENTMKQYGVERRLMTSGAHKGMLDPFSPLKPEDRKIMQKMMDEVHEQFIASVKKGRGKRLKQDPEIFSGRLYTGEQAKQLGLIDNYGDVGYVVREVLKSKKLVDYTPHAHPFDRLSHYLNNEVKSFIFGFG